MVATMSPVAVLLVAATPPISCRLRMGIRYPRGLWMSRISITRQNRSLHELRGRGVLGRPLSRSCTVRADRAGSVPVPRPDAF